MSTEHPADPDEPRPRGAFPFSLRTLAILFVPVAISAPLLLRPVPLNWVVAALAWAFAIVAIRRGDALWPRAEAGCLVPAVILGAGAISFGGSALFALAHSMDPIGPETPWFPYTFFGGIFLLVVGLVLVMARRK